MICHVLELYFTLRNTDNKVKDFIYQFIFSSGKASLHLKVN